MFTWFAGASGFVMWIGLDWRYCCGTMFGCFWLVVMVIDFGCADCLCAGLWFG